MAGVLAGTVIDRTIVGGPAWHALGADAWVPAGGLQCAFHDFFLWGLYVRGSTDALAFLFAVLALSGV